MPMTNSCRSCNAAQAAGERRVLGSNGSTPSSPLWAPRQVGTGLRGAGRWSHGRQRVHRLVIRHTVENAEIWLHDLRQREVQNRHIMNP